MAPLMSSELLAVCSLVYPLQTADIVFLSSTKPHTLQAVFLGLDIVVPLMSGELLAVPKLARLYFGLLSYMLEIWPARVADLPGDSLVV